MQNIPRWKKSDRGSSHFRHGLDPRLEPEIMRNSSAVRKLPRDDNNGMGEHPHEADRGSDQVVVTTGGPRPQRLRKPPEYFEYTQV